jgi:hypothetical protein
MLIYEQPQSVDRLLRAILKRRVHGRQVSELDKNCGFLYRFRITLHFIILYQVRHLHEVFKTNRKLVSHGGRGGDSLICALQRCKVSILYDLYHLVQWARGFKAWKAMWSYSRRAVVFVIIFRRLFLSFPGASCGVLRPSVAGCA